MMNTRIASKPASARTSPQRPPPRRAVSETAKAAYASGTTQAHESARVTRVPVVATVKRIAPVTVAPKKQLPAGCLRTDVDTANSSSDESWDSSELSGETFRPLTFTLIRGGPKRAVGCGTKEDHAITSTHAEAKESDSESELSADEIPLTVHLQANRTQRRHGKPHRGAAMEAVSSRSFSSDDSSNSSEVLPVIVEHRKRSRTVGPASSAATFEVSTSEEPRAVPSDSDSDEVPLNAEVIMRLVRRFRDKSVNPEDIPLEMFQVVNWDDDTFQPELAPLRQLYEYLEVMASLKKSVASPALKSQERGALRAKMKEAVMQLPTEQAMAAKVKAVKSKAVKSSAPKYSLYKSEFSQDASATKARSGQDGGKNAAHPSNGASPSRGKAAQPTVGKVRESAQRRGVAEEAAEFGAPVFAEKAVKAPASQKMKRKDNLIKSMTSLGSSVVEGRMSASNSEIFKPEAKSLTAQKSKGKVKESTMSEEPGRVRRSVSNRKRHNANRSVSFTDTGFPEGENEIVEGEGAVQLGVDATSNVAPPAQDAPSEAAPAEENAKPIRKRRNERRAQLGQSISFVSVPDIVVGEVVEAATALDTPSTKRAKPADRRRRPAKSNNRSFSFSDVQLEQAGEMVEEAVGADLPSGTLRSSRPVSRTDADKDDPISKGKKMVLRRRPVARKVKKELDVGAPEFGEAGEIDEGNTNLRDNTEEPPSGGTAKRRHRRSGVPRNREISISQLDDLVAGEIVENANDLAYLNTGSSPSTGGPTRNDPALTPTTRPTSRIREHKPRVSSATAVVLPSGEEIVDDMENTTAADSGKTPVKGASRGAKPDAAKRRKKRKFISQELSISAIPEEVAGEISEDVPVYLETDVAAEQQRRPPSANGALPSAGIHLPRIAAATRAKQPTKS